MHFVRRSSDYEKVWRYMRGVSVVGSVDSSELAGAISLAD